MCIYPSRARDTSLENYIVSTLYYSRKIFCAHRLDARAQVGTRLVIPTRVQTYRSRNSELADVEAALKEPVMPV